MLDILKSYFNNHDYYLIITKDKLYIKNYLKIIDIKETEVLIEVNNNIIKIIGNNLTLKRIVNKDLEIKGIIESVKYL